MKRNITNDEKHLICNNISEHKYPDNHKYNLRMIKVTADILCVPSFKSGVLLFWWCFNLVSFPWYKKIIIIILMILQVVDSEMMHSFTFYVSGVIYLAETLVLWNFHSVNYFGLNTALTAVC